MSAFGSRQTIGTVTGGPGRTNRLTTRPHRAGSTARDRLALIVIPPNQLLRFHMDVGDLMYGRSGSAFLRYPFQLDQPEALQTVSLNLDFDDGYVLYLNGQELLRRNAPTLPNHASTAPTDLGRIESQWDLTPFREYFRSGLNVLAIHGLNSRRRRWRVPDRRPTDRAGIVARSHRRAGSAHPRRRRTVSWNR